MLFTGSLLWLQQNKAVKRVVRTSIKYFFLATARQQGDESPCIESSSVVNELLVRTCETTGKKMASLVKGKN